MEKIFFYISTGSFLVSLILLLIQGIINYAFVNFNIRKYIVERTLYEQFSYEVYSSINKKLSTSISLKSECSPEEETFEFNLNLDTFFDCRDIYTDDLNSYCQNAIVTNYTNCEPDSKIVINYNDNWNILDYDHRKEYCQYYSKFTRKISILYNKKICQSKYNIYDYEYLLKNSVPNNNYKNDVNECIGGFKKCGILDTKGNILCLSDNIECPKNKIRESSGLENNGLEVEIDDNKYISLDNDNNLNIINSIVISENQPLNHEWEKMIREIHEKLESEEKKRRRTLNGEDFKFLNLKEDSGYGILNGFQFSYLNVSHIKANNSIEGFDRNIYNLKQKLNIYTRNYIGFKNYEELVRFKKYFNDKNETDNPLYQLSSSKHDPLTTIIIPVVFICISIAYLVLKIKNIFGGIISKILFYVFFIIIMLFWVAEFITILVHCLRYPKIYIDMDNRMKEILDLYNKRTLTCQICRKISIFFNTISIIIISISLYKNNKNKEPPLDENH